MQTDASTGRSEDGGVGPEAFIGDALPEEMATEDVLGEG